MSTDLPEPRPSRQFRIPVIGLGLLAWVIAVVAGAALVDPAGAQRWWAWAGELVWTVLSTTSTSSPAPSGETAPPEMVGGGGWGGELVDDGGGDRSDETDELVVRHQGLEGKAGAPSVATPMTCEGAIRAYREVASSGKAGTIAPVTENQYAEELRNGIYLRDCEVGDELRVDVCVAIRGGRIVGVSVQTTPHRRAVERCVANAVRAVELDAEPRPGLDVTLATFEPRW